MKKLLSVLFALLLLLCSCAGGAPAETPKIAETDPAVTADTDILFSAAGFETVYDEDLGASWVYRTGAESGFFARILVYKSDKISFRLICTDAASFTYGGQTYDITENDTSADAGMLEILRKIADGGDCAIGDRKITDKERADLADTLRLYEAAYAGSYTGETKSVEPAPTNGIRVYECDEYSIEYPAAYSASADGGELTITSHGTGKTVYIGVKHSDAEFSPVLADKESVKKSVNAQGGTLISDVIKTSIGGRPAYKYAYFKNGVYITQYFADGISGTYIITSGTYEKNDIIAETIVYTFKLK